MITRVRVWQRESGWEREREREMDREESIEPYVVHLIRADGLKSRFVRSVRRLSTQFEGTSACVKLFMIILLITDEI